MNMYSRSEHNFPFKVTPYSYLARGDWVLKWLERAQFSN